MNMLSPSSKMPVEIDGALVATALDLDVDRFRELMDGQKIDLLCERGTGDDIGKLRVTFYYSGRRTRFMFDRQQWRAQA